MVLISKRRNYVTIQSPVEADDGQGGTTATWTDVSEEWAAAKFMSGSRTLDQGGVKYRLAVEFRIRKGTTISEGYRIVFNSENYTIHSVLPSEKDDDQVILAYV